MFSISGEVYGGHLYKKKIGTTIVAVAVVLVIPPCIGKEGPWFFASLLTEEVKFDMWDHLCSICCSLLPPFVLL